LSDKRIYGKISFAIDCLEAYYLPNGLIVGGESAKLHDLLAGAATYDTEMWQFNDNTRPEPSAQTIP